MWHFVNEEEEDGGKEENQVFFCFTEEATSLFPTPLDPLSYLPLSCTGQLV